MSSLEIPRIGGPADILWSFLLDLSEAARVPWTLVGGQMVMLHGLEHGKPPPRISSDLDAMVDVRTEPGSMRDMVAVLESLGLVAAGLPGPTGLMHRYVRENLSVDVLVPDGLSDRTDIATSNGGRAFAAPGGTQALARSQWVDVSYMGRRGRVPRPSLLGAIVGKAVAVAEDKRDNSRHVIDLAFLLSLVGDPAPLLAECSAKDKKRLKAAKVSWA